MKETMKNIIKPLALFLILNSVVISCNAQNKSEKICNVYSVSMNKICKEWDGQWQGITVASDGNCYFGTSTHSSAHGAGFHRYDPETKTHTLLAEDMTLVLGEENSQSQQGKIHSPIVEHDGWLYFTTHLSNYWPKGIEDYTGAHAVGYEMKTGKFRDFGIIRPRYSTYSAINIDPVRKKLYVFVVPFLDKLVEADGSHLYSVDIETGEMKDLGLVAAKRSAASKTFFIDHEGNCWFTLWKRNQHLNDNDNSEPYQPFYENDNGNLYCYRPSLDKIEIYYDVLPYGELIDGTPITEESYRRERAWTWSDALPGSGNSKCLFTMGAWGGGDERLWIFDPSKDIKSGEAFQPIASIGSTFLHTALGGDRVYFVQYADLQDERTKGAEFERERDPDVVGYNESLHLRSVSITGGPNQKVTDHGKIVDHEGRACRFINSLAADNKGRVYMNGSFYVNSPKEASLQILFQSHPGENIYKLVKRGEFFAATELNYE
ncbi:MAG: hypothetical protein PHS04_01180 [Tissierellia bacterium]|nr:hypothetical protein [Tissierellia bacterium]